METIKSLKILNYLIRFLGCQSKCKYCHLYFQENCHPGASGLPPRPDLHREKLFSAEVSPGWFQSTQTTETAHLKTKQAKISWRKAPTTSQKLLHVAWKLIQSRGWNGRWLTKERNKERSKKKTNRRDSSPQPVDHLACAQLLSNNHRFTISLFDFYP